MSFKKDEIKARYIGIIDFGTYKVRVGICKLLNKDVELIGYGEKRQDFNDINLLEIKNFDNVCLNIKIAIQKAEIDAKIKVSEFVINTISNNLFFETNKINYVRKNTTQQINEQELYKIFKEIEAQAFGNSYRRIRNSSGYGKNDLKLIINNVSNIKLDNEFYSKNIIGTNPKEINASILNIFINENKYSLKSSIGRHIGKEITNILPTEYALLSLFQDRKSIVIIDLGNSHISLIIKKENYILGAKKLSFGINDLIKRIKENRNLTQIEIIKNIDTDKFKEEKTEFLEIFKDIVAITLEDILRGEICPNAFFVTGGGANKFIKDYLQNLNFNNFNLKVTKISYVTPKINFIDDKITENPNWTDEVKSNINIYAMIKASLEIMKKDKNKLEKTIKRILDDLN